MGTDREVDRRESRLSMIYTYIYNSSLFVGMKLWLFCCWVSAR